MASLSYTARIGAKARLGVLSALMLSVAAGFAGGLLLISQFGDEVVSRPSETVASHFFQQGYTQEDALISGWSKPGFEGTRSIGHRAALALELDDGRATDLGLKLEFVPHAAVTSSEIEIDLGVNGMTLGTWNGRPSANAEYWQLVVPRAVWDMARPAKVQLSFARPGAECARGQRIRPARALR